MAAIEAVISGILSKLANSNTVKCGARGLKTSHDLLIELIRLRVIQIFPTHRNNCLPHFRALFSYAMTTLMTLFFLGIVPLNDGDYYDHVAISQVLCSSFFNLFFESIK